MSDGPSILDSILATPPCGKTTVAGSIRASLLSTLFENTQPLLLSGIASTFVACVALARLHHLWAALWIVADLAILAARFAIIRCFAACSRKEVVDPAPWARWYAPAGLVACISFGLGTMACVMSGDAQLATLAIMVTAGILGGIASRNAAVPRLAITQLCFGALPIGLGGLLAWRGGWWILVPPLGLYLAAMVSVVRRHYTGLVALMTAEQKHAELAARFDAALAHMPLGLCTLDDANRVVIANRRTAELFGATVEALKLNVPLPEFIGHVGLVRFGERLRQELVKRCTAWLAREAGPLDLELTDGRQLEMTRNPVPDGSSVIIIEDVTQRREAQAQILYWASHDPLTGLLNRRDLCEQLERLLGVRDQPPGVTVAVMYLDLDGFKQVNDALGHHAGDEVLRMVSERLRRLLRQGEIVARLGGDEFAIVVESATRALGAALARRIIQQISGPYRLQSGTLARIGVSIGISFAAADDTMEVLMKRADAALYHAKEAGKGTFRFHVLDAAAEESAAADNVVGP